MGTSLLLLLLSSLLCGRCGRAAPVNTAYPEVPLDDFFDPEAAAAAAAANAEEHLHLFENLIEPEQPFDSASSSSSSLQGVALPEQPVLLALTPAPDLPDVTGPASDVGFALVEEDDDEADFPDRAGFTTGHRIPLELFSHATLMRIEDDGDAEQAAAEQARYYVDSSHFRRRPAAVPEASTLTTDEADAPELAAPPTVLVPPRNEPVYSAPSRAILELPHADPIYPEPRREPAHRVPSARLQAPEPRSKSSSTHATPKIQPSPRDVPDPREVTGTGVADDVSPFEGGLGGAEDDPAYRSTLSTVFVHDF